MEQWKGEWISGYMDRCMDTCRNYFINNKLLPFIENSDLYKTCFITITLFCVMLCCNNNNDISQHTYNYVQYDMTYNKLY